MTSAVTNIAKNSTISHPLRGEIADQFLGVILVSGAAALFWIAAIAGISHAFGYNVSSGALALADSVIFASLAFVTGALIAQR